MVNMNKIHNLPDNVKRSVTDQLKLLSWALGGVNGYFRHLLGDFFGVVLVIFGWVLLQFLAHYLIYNIKETQDIGEFK